MAYRYELDEQFEAGTRRILFDQLDRAERHLTGSDNVVTSVHEARKCFKRARALLRLVREGVGKASYRRGNISLRDIARLLAQSRDFDVMPQTLDYLRQGHAASSQALLQRLMTAVEDARARAMQEASQPPVRRAIRQLAHVRSIFEAFPFDKCDLRAIQSGMARELLGYAHRYKDALATGTADAFHEWRKSVQFHRRQLRLLSAAWPEVLEPRIALGRQLSDYLGRDHDLAVLCAFAARPGSTAVSKRDAQRIARFCRAEQADIRRRAAALGAMLAAEPAEALAYRVTAYWRVRLELTDDIKIAAE